MKSKICGISDANTLKFLTDHPLSPQFIGFIVNYPKSKRYVEPYKLKELLKIDKSKTYYFTKWLPNIQRCFSYFN